MRRTTAHERNNKYEPSSLHVAKSSVYFSDSQRRRTPAEPQLTIITINIHLSSSPRTASLVHRSCLVTTSHLQMSTTMTLTISQAPTAHACPNCGMGLPPDHSEIAADAQKQIEDLQAQVRLLTQKATAAGSSLSVQHYTIQKIGKGVTQANVRSGQMGRLRRRDPTA